MAFFGREQDLQRLEALWKRSQASLVTCRGRRRIGKSTLIRQFAARSGALLLRLEGLAPQRRMTNTDQLAAFGRQLSEQTGISPAMPATWFDAFRLLDSSIPSDGKTVVLLDEVSWMGSHDPNFAGELKFAWDNRFHDRKDLIVVVCGSGSAWIDQNILSNTGFVGRISLDLIVRELPLRDCSQFWGESLSRVAPREVLDILAVTGGVPRYLEELDPSLSADDNIGRMCFSPNGYLFRDFNDVFASVFGANAPVKRKILESLAETDLTGQELADRLGIARNGRLSSVMEELEMAGFVSKNTGMNPATGGRSRQDRYRLKDNYARFYLKYIAPFREQILGGAFEFFSVENLPAWNAVLGLQFENLVLNNVHELLPFLHLAGKQILSAAPYRTRRNGNDSGCQIDLLVQSRKSLCVVEVKRQNEIGEEVEHEVAQKLRRLKIRDGMSVRTALVYDGHLAKSVQGSGFFDALVPFSALLRPTLPTES